MYSCLYLQFVKTTPHANINASPWDKYTTYLIVSLIHKISVQANCLIPMAFILELMFD